MLQSAVVSLAQDLWSRTTRLYEGLLAHTRTDGGHYWMAWLITLPLSLKKLKRSILHLGPPSSHRDNGKCNGTIDVIEETTAHEPQW